MAAAAVANAVAPTTTRDTFEEIRYIEREVPPGGGLLVNPSSSEAYKKARHRMTGASKTVAFHDVRTTDGGLESWSLEKHGLCMVRAPPPVDFTNRKLVMREYYPKVAEVARKHAGASRGFCFQHLIRDEDPKNLGIAYARFAHADAGQGSVPFWRGLLVRKFGVPEEEAEDCEICQVNVWHPRDRPAYRDPLCLLDGSTVNREEEVRAIPYVGRPEVTEKNRDYLTASGRTFGELWSSDAANTQDPAVSNLVGPSYSPKHRWVFCSDQRPDEAWLFKQYDTREGATKCCFHNSFHDPFHDRESSCPGRRSGEFRVLLTFPKQQPREQSRL